MGKEVRHDTILLTEARLLTVLSLDTNGHRSRQGKSSTTLLSVHTLEIVPLLGVLGLAVVGPENSRGEVEQLACIYHLGFSSCLLVVLIRDYCSPPTFRPHSLLVSSLLFSPPSSQLHLLEYPTYPPRPPANVTTFFLLRRWNSHTIVQMSSINQQALKKFSNPSLPSIHACMYMY